MFLTFLIAAVLGILSGLGIGGGSLMILWLTFVQHFEYMQAKRINLVFYISSALVVVIIYLFKKILPYKEIFAAAICGCIVAVTLSVFSLRWDSVWIRKAFGGLLLLSSVREFKTAPKKQQAN